MTVNWTSTVKDKPLDFQDNSGGVHVEVLKKMHHPSATAKGQGSNLHPHRDNIRDP